jgi:flagellar hook-associated protein 2
LQNEKSTLAGQSDALKSLDAKVSTLQSAVGSLESALGVGSYNYSMTNNANTTVLSASLSSGVVAGSYSVEVTNIGAYADAMSKDALQPKVADPSATSISSASSFNLSVNGIGFTVTPTSPGLNGLVSAINNLHGANVQASAVNVGSVTAPDYRLSVQSTQLGDITVQLNDGNQDLLSTQVPGAPAQYKVNNVSAPDSASRTIQLAPGLTINLLAQSAANDPVRLTVSRSTAGVSSALNVFVSSYNAVVDELAKSRGTGDGALAGQSVVPSTSDILRGVVNYTAGSGSIQSLTQLGLEFDKTGHLSFDSTAFSSATASGFNDLSNFLGSSGDSGTGFLKAANDALNSLEDPNTGFIKTGISSLQDQMTHEDSMISDAQNRVDDLKTRLASQMAAADALIAGMEQNYTYITNLFTSMQSSSTK